MLLKLGLLGVLVFYAWNTYRELGVPRKYLQLYELSGIIENLDEVLSMSAQMAAVTGDRKWEERYRSYEPRLNGAIKEALEVGGELQMSNAVAKTAAASVRLVSIENRAFELIQEGREKEASALLDSQEYATEKDICRGGMEQITDRINKFLSGKYDDSRFKNYMAVIFILLAVPSLIVSMIVIFVMLKRYEAELRKCERRFRDMSEITGDWIWELDEKMRFKYANCRVLEMTGYVSGDIIGKTPLDLMPPATTAELGPLMDDLKKNPKPFPDLEFTILHRNGESRKMRVNGIPLYGRENEFQGYLGLCRNVVSKE